VSPGVFPCGMAVDMLRACYEVDLLSYRDRPDLVTRVRWVRAEGVPFLPFYNLFSSQVWNTVQPTSWTGPGELPTQRRPFDKGVPDTVYPATMPCGEESFWTLGAPDPGATPPPWPGPGFIPVCCSSVETPCSDIRAWQILAAGFSPGCDVGDFLTITFDNRPDFCFWISNSVFATQVLVSLQDMGMERFLTCEIIRIGFGSTHLLYKLDVTGMTIAIGAPIVVPLSVIFSTPCAMVPPTVTLTRQA
jgi:hypothetical protein